MSLKHIEWIQMTGPIQSNNSSIYIFLWLKSLPQSSRFLWCFFLKKTKNPRCGWMMQCRSYSCQEKQMGKTSFNSDKSRQGPYRYPCVWKGLRWQRLWSVSLSSSLSLSSYLPLFINQPFIKQKQLPALPKRCIDNLDMKTECLPSLPSTSAPHSAW